MAGKNNRSGKSKKQAPKKRSVLPFVIVGVIAAIVIIWAVVDDARGKKTAQTTSGSAGSASSEAVSEAAGSGEQDAAATALITGAEGLTVSHYADIEIRDYGTVTVALSEEIAPLTVKNFVSLAESGFYDGLTFHRIINGFMMQGGAPASTDSSVANVKGEFSANGVANPISHVRGAISMARANAPDSGSSQFFIVQADSTYLDGQYAGFGFVTEGMDVVDRICADAKPTDNNGSIKKEEQPVIEKVTIRAA